MQLGQLNCNVLAGHHVVVTEVLIFQQIISSRPRHIKISKFTEITKIPLHCSGIFVFELGSNPRLFFYR